MASLIFSRYDVILFDKFFMNVLIINASPKPSGSISRMLAAFAQGAQEAGHEVETIVTSKLNIRHCIGCMSCRTKGECCLPTDDAQAVLEKISKCDALVVGSPCYWGSLPGELKVMFDRMVYGLMGENRLGIPRPLHKGKKAFVITTSTTPFPFNILCGQTRGVVKALREILGTSGFKFKGTIERGGTKGKPITEHDLERCRRMARRI